MQLLLLGATGEIGSAVLTQALHENHHVTVLVRSPDKLLCASPRLRVLSGDPLDRAQLQAALVGIDAVISAVGPRTREPTHVRQQHAQALTQAMQAEGIRRLEMVSVSFLFPDAGLPSQLLGSTLFKNVRHDAQQMEAVIRDSGLDWTIVRPPRVSSGPAKGRYRVRQDHLPRGGFIISRADLASFMVQELSDGAHLRQIVGVCR